MKIYCSQIQIFPKELEKNYLTMENEIINAIKKSCDVILFPEMSITGYFLGDEWEYTSFIEECSKYHLKLVKLSKKITIIFGSVGVDKSKKNENGFIRKYNAAFCAHKGKFLKNKKTNLNFWPKSLLPNYGPFDDSRHFFDLRKLSYELNKPIQKLYEPMIINVRKKIYKIGVSICEDGWFENYSVPLVELFAKQYKHDFFINLSASPYTSQKTDQRNKVFTSQANKIKLPIIYLNACGTQNLGKNIFTFDGSSTIYLPNKKAIYFSNFCKESFFILKYEDKIFEFLESDQNQIKVQDSKIQQIQKHLEFSVKNICNASNITKVVLGLSGGIDSALTSIIFSRVLGPKNVILINMPTQFNSELTKSCAKKLAFNLGCPYFIIPINDLVHTRKNLLEKTLSENSDLKINVTDFNFENIQARERGSGILASVAASLNCVFSCNANKSEFTVGYGTLYGDIGGFMCPIGDLWKHEVYELAKFYNEKIFNREVIPKEIFEVKPSAELSPNQDVTKGLGDPIIYDYHDKLFASWIEPINRLSINDCKKLYEKNLLDKKLGLPNGTVKKYFQTKELFYHDIERWWKLYRQMGVIKRIQSPPIIATSPRCMGCDHRESF